LPYYYYLYNKLFDIDVIVNKYKFLWDQIEDEKRMINAFNNLELNKFYENKNL